MSNSWEKWMKENGLSTGHSLGQLEADFRKTLKEYKKLKKEGDYIKATHVFGVLKIIHQRMWEIMISL